MAVSEVLAAIFFATGYQTATRKLPVRGRQWRLLLMQHT